MRPAQPEWHNEDQIETALRKWLKEHNWDVLHRSSQTGEDIHAVSPNGTHWILEVKGYPATFYKKDGSPKRSTTIKTQRRTWFIEALGQIVSRIKNANWQYGVVFPDHPMDSYFERHSLSLPTFLRTALNLWIFLVNESGVTRTLSPQDSEFKEWDDVLSETSFS
ncbi:MAG: hypothetical protein CAF43_009640 [Nitrospira sp. CG24C]|jgi:hypothetical protein|nr:MAG: hypothetical protein CAF43_009640 [Nitrospira sp. CG24C]